MSISIIPMDFCSFYWRYIGSCSPSTKISTISKNWATLPCEHNPHATPNHSLFANLQPQTLFLAAPSLLSSTMLQCYWPCFCHHHCSCSCRCSLVAASTFVYQSHSIDDSVNDRWHQQNNYPFHHHQIHHHHNHHCCLHCHHHCRLHQHFLCCHYSHQLAVHHFSFFCC